MVRLLLLWWQLNIPAPRPLKEGWHPDICPLWQAVTELLTTGKLSELALLTLYLMYEKKRGKQSVWQPFIQALDRQRGRGQQGAKSPLLWDPGQAERLLAGSPVLADLHARLVVRTLTPGCVDMLQGANQVEKAHMAMIRP